MSAARIDRAESSVSVLADAIADASRGLCEALEEVARAATLAAQQIERSMLVFALVLRVQYLDMLIPLTPRPMKWVYKWERTFLQAKIEGRHLLSLGF